jgi:hypothetical protein
MTLTAPVRPLTTADAPAREARPASSTPGRRFLDALTTRHYAAIDDLVARDVWLRALLPRHLEERYGAGETTAAFRSWFERAADVRTLVSDHDTVAGKERISYRFLLRPDWEPTIDHLIEQVALLSIREGLIRKIDLVCTGFIRLDTTPPGPAPG